MLLTMLQTYPTCLHPHKVKKKILHDSGLNAITHLLSISLLVPVCSTLSVYSQSQLHLYYLMQLQTVRNCCTSVHASVIEWKFWMASSGDALEFTTNKMHSAQFHHVFWHDGEPEGIITDQGHQLHTPVKRHLSCALGPGFCPGRVPSKAFSQLGLCSQLITRTP